MSAIHLEWIEKAEGDYHTAMRDYRARKYPNYDSACFHAQQCCEKYLKAVLQRDGFIIPKTHDLNLLLDLLLPSQPFLEVYRNDFKKLTAYAVEFRYPGESASKEEAEEIINLLKRVRKEFRSKVLAAE
ncbi:MAG: HEPN domain-containing protein [FCB group bacterium]|nr:HEPN domain-containing protein [FCB group bacterium]